MTMSRFYLLIVILAIGFQTGSSQQPSGEIGCGKNKTCFFQPQDCWNTKGNYIFGTSCAVGATIADNGDGNATIELISHTGYMDGVDTSIYGVFVAFGLSYDIWMGNDSVMNCIWSPAVDPFSKKNPRVILNYNTGKHHGGDYTTNNIIDEETEAVNGTFWCRFTRQIISTSKDAFYIYPLNKKYYFLLTRGVADPQSVTPKIHSLSDGDNFPFVSTEEYYPIPALDDYVTTKGDHGWASKISRSMQYHLVYAHGGLMMLGFWVFLGTGIILGRYYKVFFPANPKIGKSAAWFQLHRGIQVTGVALIVTSFICIFISTGHLVEKDVGSTYQHMAIGMTAVVLVVLIPIGAVFRPHPNTPYRPLFKDFHFFFAFSAMALSFGSFIIAATDISKGGLTDDPNSLTCMYAVVGILGFINIFQTIYMRLFQADAAKKEDAGLFEKMHCKDIEKPNICAPWTWGLHIMTVIYVLSTLGISSYLIKVQADNGVHTLGDMFPST